MTQIAQRGTPDAQIKEHDAAYLERHGIKQLLSGALCEMLKSRPADPIQFAIDALTFGAADASIDAELGIPRWRRARLVDLFAHIDQRNAGRVTFQDIKEYTSASGKGLLTDEELRDVFYGSKGDEDAGARGLTLDKFLQHFAYAFSSLSNEEFCETVSTLLDQRRQ